MTLFKPQISIERLTVKRGSFTAYDARFHDGLNIIAGENSSGKSTVLDFIFYGLGGDLKEWREAALLCDEVILEVKLNGLSATLAREISTKSGQSMKIHLGSDGDSSSSESGWSIHPYSRSTKKESFSQVLFRLLGMPEVTGDSNSNITMHQILRIIYADQLSPVDRIFMFERFDTALTRQTVGDLLCGAFDDVLYQLQLSLRAAEKALATVTVEWRSAIAVFSGSEHDVSLEWINAERQNTLNELSNVRERAGQLEERIFNAEVSDGLSIDEQKTVYKEISETQAKKFELQATRDALQLEMKDSQDFIEGLVTKQAQLREAGATAADLQGISFIYCPSCFAPIESAGDHTCSLCKSPFDIDRAKARILSIINETGLQIKQSRIIQLDRQSQLEKLELEISEINRRWAALEERYQMLNRLPSTSLRAEARALYNRAGYLERQLEDLGDKSSLIERIDSLSKAKSKLNSDIVELQDKIEAGERRQRQQLSKAYTRISQNTVDLLQSDLDRQDLFQRAENVAFSFGDDRLSVNGESFFSASSMVYLRNSFFAAFFESSLQDPKFRHPRFLLLDTIEDKGMEPERSHRFQSLLRKMSEETSADHQIIYATAMLPPEMHGSEYIVDRFYTHDDRTLSVET